MALDRTKVKVQIVDINPFVNDQFCGFKIYWDSNIGFGEYTIYKAAGTDEWHADSELMDSDDDKWFISLLLEDLKQILHID